MRGPVKQEVLVEQHCRCNVCGREWIVAKELVFAFDTMCCWSTNVREVLGQMLFSDEHGSWTRRTGPVVS